MTIARAQLRKVDHPLARIREQWSEIEGWCRYLRPLANVATVRPNMLPTAQAGGRWSTTDPPMNNFPPELRDGTGAAPGKYITDTHTAGIVVPPSGHVWIKWDWDAIEGRLEALLSRDEVELDIYRRGHDIHTLTACTLFGLPVPPVSSKAVHTAREAAAWRAEVAWTGAEDRRRHVAKQIRYNLAYALDHRGILESLDRLAPYGVTRGQALQFAQKYCDARPCLVAAKERVGGEAARRGVARTAFGRPRGLYGDERTRRKEGWSHTISGTVSDMGNMTVCAVAARWPRATIALNVYDAQAWEFPEGAQPVKEDFKAVVQGPWEVWGQTFLFPGTFYRVWPDGRREGW